MFACLFAWSCADDDQIQVVDESAKGLSFELNAVAGMQIGTRAGAPLYSQEASQKVTRVSVYAFKKSGDHFLFAKSFTVPGWTVGTTSIVYAVAENDKLSPGEYKFLAVGRDASDNFTLTTPTVDTTTIEEMYAAITNSGDEYEVFADVKEATVTDAGTRVSLNMTRKVAGILGYFKNVPQILNTKTVKFLRLSISASDKSVNLATGVGAQPSAGYNIFNMDLSGQTVSNGYYTGNDLSGAGVIKLTNSQLMGSYLMLVSSVSMTLGLYDDTNAALKEWSVRNSSVASFDVLANHFYSLGVKTSTTSTNGGGGEGATPDNAIDLSVNDEITISITPGWAVIHNLTIQ